jgi:hypothetical protein
LLARVLTEPCTRSALTRVDLLVLDVEGYELDVIAGMRGADVLPEIVCAEHGHLGVTALREALETLGYVYHGGAEVNSFFIRADMADLYRSRAATPAKAPGDLAAPPRT